MVSFASRPIWQCVCSCTCLFFVISYFGGAFVVLHPVSIKNTHAPWMAVPGPANAWSGASAVLAYGNPSMACRAWWRKKKSRTFACTVTSFFLWLVSYNTECHWSCHEISVLKWSQPSPVINFVIYTAPGNAAYCLSAILCARAKKFFS